jgi:hypothetical protein
MGGYTRDRLHLESTNPPGHPVFEVSALESINIAESGSSKVTDDAFALTAADYRDISFLPWLPQQQVTRTLVNRKQAIAAKNNPVALPECPSRLPPERIPKLGVLISEGNVKKELLPSSWQYQAREGTAATRIDPISFFAYGLNRGYRSSVFQLAACCGSPLTIRQLGSYRFARRKYRQTRLCSRTRRLPVIFGQLEVGPKRAWRRCPRSRLVAK